MRELRPQDKIHRIAFCDWLLNRNDDFVRHLITSNEAHFHLCEYVNKQNCRFWARQNPQLFHEKHLNTAKFTVWWCCDSCMCDNATVTVNAERYTNMLITFFTPEMRQLGLRDMWV